MNTTIRASWIALCAALPLLVLTTAEPAAAGTDRGAGHANARSSLARRVHVGVRSESIERIRDIRLADVTADAWRWYLSLPTGIANDTSGANCGINQQGEFWFLGGPLGETYTTPCTIPAGKTIVAFVAAYISNDCEGDFDSDPVPDAREYLGEFAAAVVEGLVGPAAELNRQALRVRRVTTGVFPFTAAADWAIKIPEGCFTGSPQIAVSDGYWVVLPPMPRGDHTLTLSLADPATTGTFKLKIR
jgi:hypothetical protein